MEDFNSGDALPETDRDREFLRKMPEDLTPAILKVQDIVGDRIANNDAIGAHIVAAVKQALLMPMEPLDSGATRVICNATREAVAMCGFASPEIIFQLLAQRKKKLLGENES